jgi:regulator of protease activity HflC (stomatin/prohibitin superfamily)
MPWPIDTAIVEDVNLVRDLPLGTVRPFSSGDVITWGDDTMQLTQSTNVFLVGLGVAEPTAAPTQPGVVAGVVPTTAPSTTTATAFGVLPAETAADRTTATEQFAVVEADIVLQYRVRDRELDKYIAFSNDVKSRRSAMDMRERALKAMALREVTRTMSSRTLDTVLSPPPDAPLVDTLVKAIQGAFDAAETGVEVVGLSIPRLRPPGTEGGKFEELSIARQNGRRQVEDAQSAVNTTMSMLVGDVALADEVWKGIAELTKLENEAKAGSADARQKADALRARLEQIVLDSRAQSASVISNARALRWNLLMDAQAIAAEVTGQAPAWNADSELYRTRRTMDALAEALSGVRAKYMLLPDPSRVRIDVEMQETSTGLNLGDYLEKKPGDGGG